MRRYSGAYRDTAGRRGGPLRRVSIRQHVGVGTADCGAEVLPAVAFVLDDDESTCGPPLVEVPSGDERAADVQPAVDENRGQVGDGRDPVAGRSGGLIDVIKDPMLAEKCVMSPG